MTTRYTRGVWSLENVELKKPEDDWVDLPNVWIGENQAVGYQKMYGPAEYKFNFSTTTTTLKSLIETLSPGKSYLGSVSNPTHAWFNGGEPGPVSTSSKITYATDTAADSPGTRLPTARTKIGAVAGQSHSYFLGGGVPWTGSAAAVSSASKLVYASNTISDVPSGALAATGYDYKSGTGGGAYAYVFRAMGTIPTLVSNTQRITFANDTRTSLPSSNMVQFNEGPAGTSVPYWGAGNIHSTTHCYYAGGNPGGANFSSTVQKMAFASETWAVNPAKCSKSFRYQSGMTASSTQGCVAGGNISGGTSSSVDLITFATDVWAREPSMDLPSYPSGGQWNSYTGQGSTSIHDSMHGGTPGLPTIDSRWFDGASPPPNTGYSYEGSQGDTAYKTDLSSDTAATNPGAQQLTDVYNQASVSSSTAGYASGGQTSSAPSTTVSITQKTTYSSDTLVRLPGSNLPERINFNSGISDGTAGWYWGGHKQYPTTYNWTNIYKITYATEAMSTPGAQLTAGVYNASSTNSETAGYNAGGAGDYTNVDKLVFSTEATSSLPAVLPLHGNMYGTAATGTQTAGYWGGGASRTDVSKMTWATETAALIPSGFLSQGRNYMFSLGNTTDGYFCGGAPSPARTVDKLVYSTDTSAVSPSLGPSPMRNSQQNVGMGARAKGIPVTLPPTATPTNTTIIGVTPAPNNGYFTGGPHYSSTDKFNFNNDTRSAGANMGELRYNHVCWGNGTNFLDAGGTIAYGADRDSKIEKITLSNDTQGSLPGANMPNKKRFFVGATGNDNTGYIAGGQTPSSPGTSSILKVTYATYTTDANPGCHLGASGYTQGAGGHGIGSPTAAYIVAGMPSGSIGEGYHKIPYATNTATYTRPGQYDNPGAGRGDDQSTGNKDKGYTTGYNPGGFPSTKTTELVFATDTASNNGYSPNLGYALNRGATGNQTQGYFQGGLPGPAGGAGNDSYITKFVYASDTISQLPASSKVSVPRTHCDAGSGVENSHNRTSQTAII